MMNTYELRKAIIEKMESMGFEQQWQPNQRVGGTGKFGLGWSNKTANDIHWLLINEFGMEVEIMTKKECVSYKTSENDLTATIYLDETQNPSRYFLQLGLWF